MTSSYYNTLQDHDKKLYVAKLTYKGQSLPDPLDENIFKKRFKTIFRAFPNIVFGDVYIYLVENQRTYTREAFKNYKSLKCYSYITDEKVKDVYSYHNADLGVFVIKGNLQSSQTILKIHHPWIAAATDGEILAGHCTCMAGLGETCSHVAAILLWLEMKIKSLNECPDQPYVWNVEPYRVRDMVFHKQKRNKKAKRKVSENIPKLTQSEVKSFLRSLKDIVPTAPIFSSISVSDSSDADTASEVETQEGGSATDENVGMRPQRKCKILSGQNK